MSITVIRDLVYVKSMSVNHSIVKDSCDTLENILETEFEVDPFWIPRYEAVGHTFIKDGQIRMKPVLLLHQYNVFNFPLPAFHELFQEVIEMFKTVNPESNSRRYYLRSWLHTQADGDHLAWHGHEWDNRGAWTGTYYVNAEPSVGSALRIEQSGEVIDLPNKNNSFVLFKGEGTKHRTGVWNATDQTRQVIAFDFVPSDVDSWGAKNSFWIPVL